MQILADFSWSNKHNFRNENDLLKVVHNFVCFQVLFETYHITGGPLTLSMNSLSLS